jgi:hypothetical protein
MATDLLVIGHIEIPYKTTGTGNKIKQITSENRAKFFKNEKFHTVSKKQGCYIFTLKAGLGFTPWYVGKTKNSMLNECMTDGKLKHYNEVLFEGKNGKPAMFFIVPSGNKKKVPTKIIGEIETFLIQNARIQNKKIKNKQKVKPPRWSIKGVVNNTKGNPSKEAKVLKKLMGL